MKTLAALGLEPSNQAAATSFQPKVLFRRRRFTLRNAFCVPRLVLTLSRKTQHAKLEIFLILRCVKRISVESQAFDKAFLK